MPERGKVVALIRAAAERSDTTELVRLIGAHPIEVWFGMPPSEIHDLIGSLAPGALALDTVPGILLRVSTGESIEAGIAADPGWMATVAADESLRRAYVFLQALQARVAGDPVRSYEIFRPLLEKPIRSRLYVDHSGGLDSMVLLQAALSAMLAGRMTDALAIYDRVLLSAPGERAFAFFVREAYLRSALLHALYGDHNEARDRLAHARDVPRTESWVEALLDLDEVLVDATLAPRDDNVAAVERVLAVPLHLLGEMWPMYVSTLHRLTVLGDLRVRGRERIEALDAAGLAPARRTGSGLPASAFHLAYGWDYLMAGNSAAAKAQLDQADADLGGTRLLLALQAVSTGALSRALQLARSISPESRGFDQAELMRLVVIAMAHFLARAEAETAAVLRELAPRIDHDAMALLRALSTELVAFAEQHVDGWPASTDAGILERAPGLLDRKPLTPRELEVLGGLARGMTRDEIAERLYLSRNTIKTHTQSLYRKLGVASVTEAVLEGGRRGLL